MDGTSNFNEECTQFLASEVFLAVPWQGPCYDTSRLGAERAVMKNRDRKMVIL